MKEIKKEDYKKKLNTYRKWVGIKNEKFKINF